jgi:peptide/nickel transport system ATP-binding protein
MALALNPRLIIADEPTTALDVTVQAQIIRLMRRVQREFGTAIIIITHDLGVIAEIADDIMVMYAGRAMEHATKHDLFRRPSHPYTRGLLASIPRIDGSDTRLTPIPGQPPSLISPPTGCPFQPRCATAIGRCAELPPFMNIDAARTHQSACWLADDSVVR